MKVFRYTKRDRRTPGLAVGSVVCNLTFPETDERFEIRPLGDSKSMMAKVRRFAEHHINERRSQLKGAKLTIAADVRGASGALKRSILSEWNNGDDLKQVIKIAAEAFKNLQMEEARIKYEANLHIQDDE